jgi:hypothetical protein
MEAALIYVFILSVSDNGEWIDALVKRGATGP